MMGTHSFHAILDIAFVNPTNAPSIIKSLPPKQCQTVIRCLQMNLHPNDTPHYVAYLLRLWCVTTAEGTHWRASLENVQTRQVKGFGSLRSLFDYLERETEALPTDDRS
jgi:hypothetical protein